MNGAEGRTNKWQQWIPLLIVVLTVPLHLSAVDGWWLWDDPQLILHALRVDTIDTFFNPAAYASLATHTFTPLLPVSFKLDLLIGGFSPTVSYIHQLIAMLLAGLLLDQLLRRYVDRWVAALTSLAFLGSWMAVYAVRTLMIRHYVEGLVFVLAALILWSGRRDDAVIFPATAGQRLAASALWFLALLEKEIFALAPLFLILQKRANGATWRESMRALFEPAVAALVWLAWRTWMLGSIGGYGDEVTLRDLALLPVSLLRALSPPDLPWITWIICVVAAAVATLAVARRPRRFGAVLAFVAVAIIPVVTLADNFEWRYAFGAAVVLHSGIAIALSVLDVNVRVQRVVAALIAFLAIVSAPFAARAYAEITQPVEAEGLWLWERDGSSPGLVASAPSWYLTGVRDIKNMTTAAGSPRFVSSTLPFALHPIDPSAWVRWDSDARRLAALGIQDVIDLRKRRVYRSGIRLVVERDENLLTWSFEADEHAQWSIVMLPHFERWDVPAQGERRIPASDDPGAFLVIATWDDGTWTPSGELAFPLDGEATRWTVR